MEPRSGRDEKMIALKIRGKLWLEKDGELLFGPGRLELLAGLAQHGSLAEAARRLGMSYRAAWGRLRASEARLGQPLAVRRIQEGQGQKLILTPLAESLIKAYQEIQQDFTKFLAQEEKKLQELAGALNPGSQESGS